MGSAGYRGGMVKENTESMEEKGEKVAVLRQILQQKIEENNKRWNLLIGMITEMIVLMQTSKEITPTGKGDSQQAVHEGM